MTDAKKKATVATPSSAYARMAPKWRLIDCLLGGTSAMRSAGKEFLPQHDQESNKNYDNRLQRATLVNATERVLDVVAGKPFKDKLDLGEDVPAPVAESFAPDVDRQGRDLQAFCRDWFRVGWAKGLAHVLVDAPQLNQPTNPDGSPRPRTVDDDRRENVLPYWVLIQPENLIAAYSEVRDGQEVLTHVRFRTVTTERVGFEEVDVIRVTVLEEDKCEVWAPDEKGEDWHVESSVPNPTGRIELVTFYAGRRLGLMECKLPLEDLAHLNVAHWQSSSDQRNVLTVARFPILAASGVDADASVKIGPNNFLSTPDAQGKWYYVEHTGAAIEAGRHDLEDLEDQMSAYGAELLRKKPGTETATGRALDSAESASQLDASVKDFEDCLALALQYTAERMGFEEGGIVTLTGDTSLTDVDSAELDAIVKLRANGDLSRRRALAEMQRRRVLAEDFDADKNDEELKDEGDSGMGDLFGGGRGTGVLPPAPAPQPPAPPAQPPAGDA